MLKRILRISRNPDTSFTETHRMQRKKKLIVSNDSSAIRRWRNYQFSNREPCNLPVTYGRERISVTVFRSRASRSNAVVFARNSTDIREKIREWLTYSAQAGWLLRNANAAAFLAAGCRGRSWIYFQQTDRTSDKNIFALLDAFQLCLSQNSAERISSSLFRRDRIVAKVDKVSRRLNSRL